MGIDDHISSSPEMLGYFGMIPRILTMNVGFGRTGLGRDEIYPDVWLVEPPEISKSWELSKTEMEIKQFWITNAIWIQGFNHKFFFFEPSTAWLVLEETLPGLPPCYL